MAVQVLHKVGVLLWRFIYHLLSWARSLSLLPPPSFPAALSPPPCSKAILTSLFLFDLSPLPLALHVSTSGISFLPSFVFYPHGLSTLQPPGPPFSPQNPISGSLAAQSLALQAQLFSIAADPGARAGDFWIHLLSEQLINPPIQDPSILSIVMHAQLAIQWRSSLQTVALPRFRFQPTCPTDSKVSHQQTPVGFRPPRPVGP